MLEFLLLTLFSQTGRDFFAKNFEFPAVAIEDLIQVSEIPKKNPYYIAPVLETNEDLSVLAIDLPSNTEFLSHNTERIQNIASLSKIMTALIILEEHSLDEIVVVAKPATEAVGARIGLYEYEKLTVNTLLEAMLIPSANDAAVALAIHNAGTEDDFVKKMNSKAKELQLFTAQFYNSTGLDVYDKKEKTFHGNEMSAQDLLLLTKYALKNSKFREIIQKSYFSGESVDNKFKHSKESTNILLNSFLNLKGVKTGFTQLAGQCLISLGTGTEDREILVIILGAEDRFSTTKNILSWIYDVWQYN